LALPGGALVIDTPGMRALALWDAEEGVEQVFADVAALAEECRFRDCAHRGEPGCAVQAAVDDGRLDPARVASWRKLQRELAMLAARQDARLRAERTKQWKQITASSRNNPKIRGQNRGRR
jgi:ribosome biogenesis GTPase